MEWEFSGQGDGHEAQVGLKGPEWPEGLREGTQGWSKGLRVTVAGDAVTEVGRAMEEVWHTPFPRPGGATEGLAGGARCQEQIRSKASSILRAPFRGKRKTHKVHMKMNLRMRKKRTDCWSPGGLGPFF